MSLEMSVLYEVKCECGKVLEILNVELDEENNLLVEVEPCEDCTDKADTDGYERGFENGKKKPQPKSESQ